MENMGISCWGGPGHRDIDLTLPPSDLHHNKQERRIRELEEKIERLEKEKKIRQLEEELDKLRKQQAKAN